MIKKYILWTVISFVWLFWLSFVNARCDWNNAYCNNLPFWQASDDLVNGAIIDNSFNFRYWYFNFSYDWTRYFNYWWQDDWLYFTKTDWRWSSPQYWKVDWYFVCSWNPFLWQTLSSISSCEYHTWFNDFWSQIISKDLYWFYCSVTQWYSNCNLCVYSSWSSYVCVDRSYISDTHDTFLDIVSIEWRLTQNPYASWYYDYWGSNYYYDVWLDWDLSFSACTNGDVFLKLREIFWGVSICYAWTYNTWLVEMSWNYDVFTYSTWFTFKELYQLTNDWMSWSEWFNSNLYELEFYQTHNVAWRSFLWKPIALYNYFVNLNRNWILYWMKDASNEVLNYCELALYSDLEKPYNWTAFKDYCQVPWSYWTWSDNISWTVAGFSWDWVLSGADQEFDWTSFINQFSQKLKTAFIKPSWSMFGIVPNYILVFMFALILFRFLQH